MSYDPMDDVDYTVCEYVNEFTGEQKGCGSFVESGKCDDCELADWIAYLGPDEYKRRCDEAREKRDAEFQASLAWNRLNGSMCAPPANWREIVARQDALDQSVKVVYGDHSGEDEGELCSLRSVYDGLKGDSESRLGMLDFAARVCGDTLTIPSICGTYLRIERAA